MTTSVAFLFDESNDWMSQHFSSYDVQRTDFKSDIFHDADNIKGYDIVFILGYTKILPSSFLDRNALNLVIHESDLPNGKGFAPVQWQLLEGKDEIKISLIEASESVDSGDIILQSTITFDGTELYEKIRLKQAHETISLIDSFIEIYPDFERKKQIVGGGGGGVKESFYRKRTPKDGELDINKSIKENFNLLRIGNNENWPSFFTYKDKKFIIKIYEYSE